VETETPDRPGRRAGAGRATSSGHPDRPGPETDILHNEDRPRRPDMPGRRGKFRNADGTGENGPRGRGRERSPARREYVRKVMNWLKETDPKEYKRLSQLREENPRALQKELGPVLQKYAKEKHPDQYKRLTEGRKQARMLRKYSHQYRNETDPQKRAGIEKKMREELAAAFDKKQESRQKELEKLEKRIKEFRETLEKNSQNRQAIIDSQIKKWTEETEPKADIKSKQE
jgi:hypothetical protein